MRRIPALLAGLSLGLLAACTSAGTTPGSATDPSASPPAADPASGAVVVEVREDVDYYGACGNEILEVGGATYYPLPEEEVDLDDHAVEEQASDQPGAAAAALLPKVPAPGEGDDVGDLVVFDDGIARFESDSGRVVWLTAERRTYDFVC